jgi:hypothetical protein
VSMLRLCEGEVGGSFDYPHPGPEGEGIHSGGRCKACRNIHIAHRRAPQHRQLTPPRHQVRHLGRRAAEMKRARFVDDVLIRDSDALVLAQMFEP